MRNIHKKIYKVLTAVLSIVLLLFPANFAYAYDVDAPHEVNLYYRDPEMVAKLQKTIWAEMRTWGLTEAGCAGVLGNMMAESGCDPTRTQSDRAWENCTVFPATRGNTGLGLTQWTFYTRQQSLFELADSMGKQWTDLGVQLAMLKNELSSGYDILYSSDDVNDCADYFLTVYEKPANLNYSTRRQLANTVYSQLQGTEPKEYNGSSSSEDNSSVEDTEVTEEQISAIVKERDLVGMSGLTSSVLSNQEQVELATRAGLSISEQYSVVTIGQDVALAKQALTLDNARIAVVFVGLVFVFYAVLLLLAMLLDKVNTFVEISFVKLVTFGFLQFTEDEELKASRGYASVGKMITVIVVTLVIGCLLISGGIIPFMISIVEWIKNLF